MQSTQQLTESRISHVPRRLTFKCREIDEYPSTNNKIILVFPTKITYC